MGEFFRELPQPVAVDAFVARLPGSATIVGAGGRRIRGIAPLSPGRNEGLSFCDPEGTPERVRGSRSSVVIVTSRADLQPRAEQTLIMVEDPRAWFIRAVEALLPAVGRASAKRCAPRCANLGQCSNWRGRAYWRGDASRSGRRNLRGLHRGIELLHRAGHGDRLGRARLS